MYAIKINAKLIFDIILFISVLYSTQLFVLWTHQSIYDKELTSLLFSLPMIIIVCFVVMILLSMITSDIFYSYIYTIFGVYLGYIFYLFHKFLLFLK